MSGHWSDWRPGADAYSLGVEEELMVLGGQRLQLEPAGPRAAEALPPRLRDVVSVETHASALEIHTGVHDCHFLLVAPKEEFLSLIHI